MYNAIYVDLKNTPNYYCSVDVFGVPMLLNVSYNTRSMKRLISLTSLDGETVFLKPTYITKGSRVFPNFYATYNDLQFYIALYNYSNSSGEDYSTWANDFKLCFVEYEKYEKPEGTYKVTDNS